MSAPTIPRRLRDQARARPGRVAARHKRRGLWRDLTWAEYFENARRVAAALAARGLAPGDRVAILGENGPEWVAADLGTLCAGGVSVGIYTTSAAGQVEYVVADSGARLLFLENEEQLDKWLAFRDRAPELRVVVWDLKGLRGFRDPAVTAWADLLAEGEAALAVDPGLVDRRIDAVGPGDLALLIYTSGTTGPPKGAMLTHGNVAWMGEAITRDNPVDDRDEVLSFLPLCHIFERLFTVLAHVTVGYTVNFVEGPDTVTDNMVEVSPTVGYAVPRIWEKYASAVRLRMAEATWFKRAAFGAALWAGTRWADRRLGGRPVPGWLGLLRALAHLAVFRKLKERLGFERMRVAYSGAAPISPEVLRFFQALGVNLVEGYGQTEGTGVTCVSRAGRVRLGTVGQPLTGVEVQIADDGEILVRSPGVFRGYWNQPQATAEALDGEWLRSGDVGELDAEGFLKITDRKKDIFVNAAGKNIAPQYIENQLKFSPYVNDAVVVGDRRRYVTCLVLIDEENVAQFAQDHRVPFATYRDLTQRPEVVALVQREVDQVNVGLSRVEQIKAFRILPKKLYEEDGEVTPTLKVKRAQVHAAFRDLIDDMYRAPGG